jgi:hypothetical protein
VDPADRPGASGADQRRQACLRSQVTNIIQRAPQKVGHTGRRIPSNDRECDETAIRSQLQLAVATSGSASHRLMKIPGQMVRMTSLAPTAGATTGVRPPLVAPAVPASSGLQSSVAMVRLGFLDQGRSPRVVGWTQNPATPTTPPYPAFRPRRTGHRGRPTPHEVAVQCRQVKRPEFLAPTVVKLSR